MTLATEASAFWSSVRVTEKGVGANAEDASSASAIPASGQVARRRLGSGMLSKSSISGKAKEETTPADASNAPAPVPTGGGLSLTVPQGGSSETITPPSRTSSDIAESEAPDAATEDGNPAKKPRLSDLKEEGH